SCWIRPECFLRKWPPLHFVNERRIGRDDEAALAGCFGRIEPRAAVCQRRGYDRDQPLTRLHGRDYRFEAGIDLGLPRLEHEVAGRIDKAGRAAFGAAERDRLDRRAFASDHVAHVSQFAAGVAYADRTRLWGPGSRREPLDPHAVLGPGGLRIVARDPI